MSQKRSLLTVCTLLVAVVFFGVASAGRVGAQDPPAPDVADHQHHHHGHESAVPENVEPLTLSPVATNTTIADLIARVDSSRWYSDVNTLAAFGTVAPNAWGTRYTGSAGNIAARDWISESLSSLGWTSTIHSFSYSNPNSFSFNVIGERIGELYPDNVYIVSAHFDSISFDSDPTILAPGAEDNASGTAGLLEIARVLQDETPASTIRLIAFSGEEQGLYGSTAYVSDLKQAGELDNVKGVYNLDMIGFTSDSDLDVILESDSESWMGDFRDHLAAMAAAYTPLQVTLDDDPCCSDHKPFLDEEVPAVLLIEAEYWDYFVNGLGHSANDVPDNVVPAEGEAIIQAVVAALAEKTGIVCMLADLDCNGTVELTDVVDLAAHWHLSLGEPGFADEYDLNDDDTVNVIDLQLAAQALVQ